jgi:hypothetical protein
MGLLPDGKPSVKEADEFYQFAKMVVNAATQATRNSCIEDAEK